MRVISLLSLRNDSWRSCGLRIDITTYSTNTRTDCQPIFTNMAVSLPKHVGWIGLGLMGLPMATNLLKKMDADTEFYVYDVMQESVDHFVGLEEAKGRAEGCKSSLEVADKSVCHAFVPQ